MVLALTQVLFLFDSICVWPSANVQMQRNRPWITACDVAADFLCTCGGIVSVLSVGHKI